MVTCEYPVKSSFDRHEPALFVGDDAGDAEVLEKGLVFTAAMVTPIWSDENRCLTPRAHEQKWEFSRYPYPPSQPQTSIFIQKYVIHHDSQHGYGWLLVWFVYCWPANLLSQPSNINNAHRSQAAMAVRHPCCCGYGKGAGAMWPWPWPWKMCQDVYPQTIFHGLFMVYSIGIIHMNIQPYSVSCVYI